MWRKIKGSGFLGPTLFLVLLPGTILPAEMKSSDARAKPAKRKDARGEDHHGDGRKWLKGNHQEPGARRRQDDQAGMQNGRGWTLVISEESGKMSATISNDQVGYVLFGVSTPLR